MHSVFFAPVEQYDPSFFLGHTTDTSPNPHSVYFGFETQSASPPETHVRNQPFN